ncbi:MAG TPA: glycosyltransferase [Actinocrinis sp.]|nr:glycosyltransferase [Actinocrinis sp.]
MSTAAAVSALVALIAVDVRQSSTDSWTALWTYGLAWLAFAAAVWLVRGVPVRAAAWLILGGCLAAGLAAAGAPERQSDDLYRYVWDGHVQAAGIDPYSYVPAAPRLAGLRSDFLWPDHDTSWCVTPGTPDPDQTGTLLDPGCTLINRPAVHTIYPPVAQAYFYTVDQLSPAGSRYKAMQLAAVALAVATAGALLLGLRALRRDPRAAALWAWCPLVVFEAGNGAHIDVLGALLSVAALVVLARSTSRRGRVLGGVLLGLAIGAKLTPVFAAPAMLRRRAVVVGGSAVATLALMYLPHVLAVGGKVIGYIPGYLNEQGYDSGTGYVLLGMVLPQSWTSGAAVLIAAGVGLAVYLRANPDRPWRGAVLMTGSALLLTSPAYAWYALLLCAFIALDGTGSLEWLALATPDFIARVAQAAGMGSLAANRLGYGLAAAAVLAGWAVRARLRRRALTEQGDAPVPAVGALVPDRAPDLVHSHDAAVLVDVILPCLDEAAALPYVLGGLPAGYRAIVVDNGSTDDSAAVAARLGALVVTEPRRGFGAACHAGLSAATAPVVCFCDCDGSFDPAQLPRVADPVLGGRCDLVLGRRRPSTAGAWPVHARIANQVLAFRLRRVGVPVRDLGPMRAARREALLGLDVADRRSGYPLETVLKAAAAGWRITETTVDYAPRTGKSKVTGTVSGTVKAVRDMTRVWNEASQ